MNSAADARLAAALLALDPLALGGARVVAAAGPVRDAWLECVRTGVDPARAWRRLPPQIGDDRLLGGLDLGATLAAGRPVLQPGVLAEADGGCLVAPMAERMAPGCAAQLCAALDRGCIAVQRDGFDATLPARVALLALDEALPDDEPMSPALADRLALWIDLRAVDWRAWTESAGVEGDEAELAAARARLPQVRLDDDTLQALCGAAQALGADSSRAAWLATRAAIASAALFGRSCVQADDAALAARLVLGPRATRLPPSDAEAEAAPDDDPPDPPPPDTSDAERGEPGDTQPLDDRVLDAAQAAIPAGLLARLVAGDAPRSRGAGGGKAGALTASRLRGRPLGARPGSPHAGERLHLLATLRAAAPWQRLRTRASPGAIALRREDFHVRRHAERRSTTTVFAVDASGSQALHRLAEAKGAVELLLAECYVRRDEVALIAFRGTGAELLLPPTRSLVRAKRALAALPGGGGTPLALGLEQAARVARQVLRNGATPVVVVLTDGRANVDRHGAGGREQARTDALAAAQALRALGAQTLLIDTSPRAEAAAAALALAMGARYLALPQADARALARSVMAAT